VSLIMEPSLYQTRCFRDVAIALLLAVVALQRLYTRRLRARTAELARVVEERTRDLSAQRHSCGR